ncbi:MAG: MutS2/Smr-associated SH3 domain-containing protein, partial [Gemmatimonadales bacterium]
MGDAVRASNGVSGTVSKIRRDGKVVVAAGAMKLTVEASELSRDARPVPRDS